jgi:SepF-like predicted cell division protein (DUF552 family)
MGKTNKVNKIVLIEPLELYILEDERHFTIESNKRSFKPIKIDKTLTKNDLENILENCNNRSVIVKEIKRLQRKTEHGSET